MARGEEIVGERGVMVYHAPYPLQENPTAASGLRPVKMLEAFEELGYRVWRVTGYAKERHRSIRQLKRAMKRGLHVDFCYSESATIPMSFTEPRHLPLHLLLDMDLFRHLRANDVPVGVFYRDLYWVFPEYRERVGSVVAAGMKLLYRWDLAAYNKYVNVLFVPSLQMAEHIPGSLECQVVALPPGADYFSAAGGNSQPGRLRLLYVGGTNRDHYDLDQTFRGLAASAGIEMTVCTPEAAWAAAKGTYDLVPDQNLRVVHKSATELGQLYEKTDVAVLFVDPHDYWEFAVPVKLYEYLGHGKPIIATEGTMAAQIVNESGAGWVLPYSADAFTELVCTLAKDPTLLDVPRRNAQNAGLTNTWVARAQEAAATLLSTSSS